MEIWGRRERSGAGVDGVRQLEEHHQPDNRVGWIGVGGAVPRLANPDVALYHYVNGSLVRVTPSENLLPGG